MKELNALMPYIRDYIYDAESERIVRHSSHAEAAAEAYDKAVLSFVEYKTDRHFGNPVLFHPPETDESLDEGFLGLIRTSSEQWELDIAIDCVRQMSSKDRAYIIDHPWVTEYHFGYAMYIRNHYIHPAKLHHTFMADDTSSDVMRKIFSILIPGYDFRRKECTKYFESFTFHDYHRQYGEMQKDVFDEVAAEVLADGAVITAKEALEKLCRKLTEKLGKDEFIRIFRKHYLEAKKNESRDQKTREDFWDRTFRYATPLYTMEYNQIRALMNLGFIKDIASMSIMSLEECRRFIDTRLGLKDEYAEYMARCGWEACNPITNGLWKELQLHPLDLGYRIEGLLENRGVRTLGDLARRTYDELAAIPDIGEENADLIRDRMEALGLRLSVIKKTIPMFSINIQDPKEPYHDYDQNHKE